MFFNDKAALRKTREKVLRLHQFVFVKRFIRLGKLLTEVSSSANPSKRACSSNDSCSSGIKASREQIATFLDCRDFCSFAETATDQALVCFGMGNLQFRRHHKLMDPSFGYLDEADSAMALSLDVRPSPIHGHGLFAHDDSSPSIKPPKESKCQSRVGELLSL
jgi:hypothetical protein